MATRVSEDEEVQSHYVTQAALSTALLAALRRLWPTVEPLNSPVSMEVYRDGVAGLVEQFAQAAISLSADFYESMREHAGISTGFRTPIIDPPPRSLIDAGLDWAASAQTQMDADIAEMQSRVDAAMQKAVADAGRSQVVAAVEGDELALGFARVAKPDACFWCLAMAIRRNKEGRAGVYKSRETAGQLPPNEAGEVNRYHNNCQCVVVPVFSASFELEPHLADAEEMYVSSTINSKPGQSLNDFRRALEARRRGKSLPTPSPTGPSGAPSGPDQLAALLGRIADLGA